MSIENLVTQSRQYTNEDALNNLIRTMKADTNKISDGYHTFEQLYEHRIVLYIAICRILGRDEDGYDLWMSKKHSDGSEWDGWFMLGIGTVKGSQITYHLPIKYWGECNDISSCEVLEYAPSFDGHTSEDVLQRLKSL